MNSNANQSITIGPRFFQMEKSNYANWQSAFARELLQNSIDARASIVKITTVDSETETKIIVEDDGRGMSRDILLTKFMVMGETGKEGTDTVGGFGKARVLIAWAANNYEIISSDYHVTGCGSSFSVADKPFSKGCTFIITQPKRAWAEYFKAVIDNCTTPFTRFEINGEPYRSKMKNKGRAIRELSFGMVFVNKTQKDYNLIVRVGGIFMFSRHITAPVQVVIELDPAKAKTTLLSNRDGLAYECNAELNAFLDELAADTHTALRDKTRKFTVIRNRGQHLMARSRQETPKMENATDPNVISDADIKLLEQLFATAPESGAQTTQSEDFADAILNVNPVISDPVIQSMLIHNLSNDANRVKVINTHYHPDKWTEKSTRYQLLKIWATINSIVMEELATMLGRDVPYSNGWVFSDDGDERIDAINLNADGIHYLLLNPIDETNKIAYSVTSVDDYFKLIVYSVHEAAHVVSKVHDETFSTAMTHLMVKVMNRRKEIVAACKEAK